MKSTAIITALSVALVTFASASSAQAASARTFVSGTGSDANAASDCPRPTPCRNFQAAHDVTLSGGEIIALDPNGYGTLIINRPITVVGAETAQVVVPVSGTGITVNAGAGNLVVLRNIQVFGANRSNTTGIDLNSGDLVISRSSLERLATGLDVADTTRTDVVDSEIIGNVTGVVTNGTGVPNSFPLSGGTQVRMSGGSVLDNGTAYSVNAPGTNNFTILFDAEGSGTTTYHAGNDVFVVGDGAGCPCTNGLQIARQTNQNPN